MNKKSARTPQDTVERYIRQVLLHMPANERDAAQAELREKIDEMLKERCSGAQASDEDVEAVLTALGSPGTYASQHSKVRYLIGPSLFYQYITVMKIVLAAVAVGTIITSVIQSLTDKPKGFEVLSVWYDNISSGLLSAVVFVTLIFAVFEYRGIKLDFAGKDWIKKLPPLREDSNRIKKSDCIFGIVVTVLFLIIFIAVPENIVFYYEGRVIPLLNMEAVRTVLPLIIASCLLSIIKDTVRLIAGKYTVGLALGITAVDMASLIIGVAVLSTPIWNRSLIVFLNGVYELVELDFLQNFGNSFAQIFMTIVIFGFVIDILTLWFRTLKAAAVK